METRRKQVGQHIKATRRTRQYRSQRAFAAAIGVHESSVAYAETGSDRIGDLVYSAIERGLDWPTRSITDFIEGKTDQLPGAADEAPSEAGDVSAARQRIIEMSHEEIAERIAEVAELQGPKAAGELLKRFLSIREEARQRT